MMRRHLTKSQSTAAPLDQAWRIVEALEGEARDYLINKLESERNEPEKVFTYLSRRFGSGGNNIQVRRSLPQRDQRSDEDVMQHAIPGRIGKSKSSQSSPSERVKCG